jgi:hypothetical protein
MSTEEWIARGALGLLSFIILIVLLRWLGPPEDQKKDEPPKVPKGKERQSEDS